MTWQMNDKEFSSVQSLPAPKRYAYFIKHVADWQQIWSLHDEHGWVLYGDDEGNELIPVWPHSRFAQVCAVENHKDYKPRSIEVHEWLNKWIPGMIRDHRLVAVFPLPSQRGIPVSPERLKADLGDELALIE